MDTSPPDEAFRDLLLRHRGRTGLTQRDLAARSGVSIRSVQDWEAGVNYPSVEGLRRLIAGLLGVGGLTAGRESVEARSLWSAVQNAAPRMRTPFDPVWLARLLVERATPAGTADYAGAGRGVPVTERTATGGATERRQDWGEAPDASGFVGRAQELTTLTRWILEDHCRLVAVLGMGGIGKTSLATRLAQEVAPSFEQVYWRSLRDAPPPSEWLAGAISFLSDQHLVPPSSESERLAVLLGLLRVRPCLVVLDNFESLFEPGHGEGHYRAGLDGYGRLLQAVGDAAHPGCLILTSREAPVELALVDSGVVRTFPLGGLGVGEARVLLNDKRLAGNSEQWVELIARYAGNGLALKLVGESVREVFGGEIGLFLEETNAGGIFGGIRRLLAEQVERSSVPEQRVLRALAVEREPVRLATLLADLDPSVGRGVAVEAIEGLRRRSLVERAETAGVGAFTLQSVVLEYVTERLVEDVVEEIELERLGLLVEQPLIQAQARDYVRQTQERLIGAPILQRLITRHDEEGAERRLLALLADWRDRAPEEQGYGPGNTVNLLRLLRGDLRGLDLSHLAMRQVYLAEVEAQDARLVGARLDKAVLADTFSFPGAVALSSDGALLAAGTMTGEVWLWRVSDRAPLMAVQGHAGGVWGLALSADGRLLASGGLEGSVRLWEAGTGRSLAMLEGHTGSVRTVALSAAGHLLASGSQDGTVRLWETSAGRLLATLEGHTGSVRAVALSADGHLLASAGDDGLVWLWETGAGRLLATLKGHTSAVSDVALSANGHLLASGGIDGTVRLWETGTGRRLATLDGHTGLVRGVALSADGRLLVSGGADGTVRLWEAVTGWPLATLRGHTSAVWGTALSADGRLLASGGADGTVRLWEAGAGQPLATLQGHTGVVWSLALSADGHLLASGSQDGTVRLWEAGAGQPLATLQGHTGVVWSLALSADGHLLASGGEDGTVRLWDAGTGRPAATFEGHTGAVRSLALSADGHLLASGGADGAVRLWETSAGQPLATLQGHTGEVRGLALTAAGHLLASGGQDGTVRLWEASAGRLLAILEGHTAEVSGVALTAAGHLLASGGQDGTVRLWEASAGRLLSILEGHTGPVFGVALSADGHLLASGSQDGTVRLWQAGTGRPLSILEGHTGPVRVVALSADGHLLASGGIDGSVRLWEASSGTCLHVLRSDRRYERLDITGLTGITDAQRQAMLALGGVELTATQPGVT